MYIPYVYNSGDLAKTTVHTEDLKKGDYFYKTTVCTEVWENVYDLLATVRYKLVNF